MISGLAGSPDRTVFNVFNFGRQLKKIKKIIKLKKNLSVFILWSVQIWTPQPDIKDLLYPGLGHSLAALTPEGQLQHKPDSPSPSPETVILGLGLSLAALPPEEQLQLQSEPQP